MSTIPEVPTKRSCARRWQRRRLALTAPARVCVQLPEAIPASDVFDGVVGVWTEVVAKKISSEEESWSDDSLMIYYNNWLGGFSQIAPFAKGEVRHPPPSPPDAPSHMPAHMHAPALYHHPSSCSVLHSRKHAVRNVKSEFPVHALKPALGLACRQVDHSGWWAS